MKSRHFVSATTLIAVLFCAVPTTHAAMDSRLATASNAELVFEGIASIANVLGEAPAGPIYNVNVGQLATGLPSKSYGAPRFAPVEYSMHLNGVIALTRVLNDYSAGRGATLTTQVRLPIMPALPEYTFLGDCSIAYFEFPKLGAGSKSAALFKLGLVPSAFEPLTAPRPAKPGTVVAPTATFIENSFTVSIPGLDCSRVISVGGIRMSGGQSAPPSGTENGRQVQTTNTGGSNGNITIEASGVSARAFRDWMLANANGAPSRKELMIRLVSPSTQATLLTVRGIGVGLIGVYPRVQPTAGSWTVDAELFVERWELLLPEAPKEKLALPTGITLPGGRK